MILGCRCPDWGVFHSIVHCGGSSIHMAILGLLVFNHPVWSFFRPIVQPWVASIQTFSLGFLLFNHPFLYFFHPAVLPEVRSRHPFRGFGHSDTLCRPVLSQQSSLGFVWATGPGWEFFHPAIQPQAFSTKIFSLELLSHVQPATACIAIYLLDRWPDYLPTKSSWFPQWPWDALDLWRQNMLKSSPLHHHAWKVGMRCLWWYAIFGFHKHGALHDLQFYLICPKDNCLRKYWGFFSCNIANLAKDAFSCWTFHKSHNRKVFFS